jgi:hypothetical protein
MQKSIAGSILLVASMGAGCTGILGDPGEGADLNAASAVVVSGARRLSRAEYDNTLRDLLNDETRSGFAKLPEDVNDPFDNDVSTQQVSPALIEAAETLAQQAAARAVADPAILASIVPCTPAGPGDADCMRKFVASFGRRALRRPLSTDEIGRYLGLQAFAVEKGDFNVGVELVLQAMLQDVEFLYRIEAGTPVPGHADVFKLNDFEVATRLSYFLLGTTPGDALLDLAQGGQLSTPEGVRAAAASLLDDPRARQRVERFHALWLGFHQLPHAADLTGELRTETAALIDRVVFGEPSSYFELFQSEESFLTPFLADHYGLPAPSTPSGEWVSYGDSGRKGILSHGSVLSAGAKFADTSPTQRGIFVRTRLLCQAIVPPPPNVDADNPPPGDGTSDCKVDKYKQHTQGGCAACHNQYDPIGFGLENYDKAGRYRAHDDGNAACLIDGEGALEGVGAFNGPGELADLLIDSGELEACVVKQVYRFALGRRETAADGTALTQIAMSFRDGGFAFDQVLMDIVSSDFFGYRRMDL